MGSSFLEFFDRLQPVQVDAQQVAEGTGPSAAAINAASAAPVRRRSSGPAAPNQNDAGTSGDQQPEPMRTEGGAAEPVLPAADTDIPWDEIQNARHRLGPQLKALRAEQNNAPSTRKEVYSMEHVKRLTMFAPARPYNRPRKNNMCSKTHPQPCPYNCKTCHFCRQRTTEIKTVCSTCNGVNNFYGGPARGYWCGSCLWLRVGENIDEVRDRSDWQCPACRDLCNCSGANCMRLKRGWFPTNQLSHEATQMGFASVAHYLVLTHVSDQAVAAPIADNSAQARVMPRQRQELEPSEIPAPKRQKTLEFFPGKARMRQLEERSKSKLQQQELALDAELGGIQFAAPQSSPFLGILDSDIQYEDADVPVFQSFNFDFSHPNRQQQQRQGGGQANQGEQIARGTSLFEQIHGHAPTPFTRAPSWLQAFDFLPPRVPRRRQQQQQQQPPLAAAPFASVFQPLAPVQGIRQQSDAVNSDHEMDAMQRQQLAELLPMDSNDVGAVHGGVPVPALVNSSMPSSSTVAAGIVAIPGRVVRLQQPPAAAGGNQVEQQTAVNVNAEANNNNDLEAAVSPVQPLEGVGIPQMMDGVEQQAQQQTAQEGGVALGSLDNAAAANIDEVQVDIRLEQLSLQHISWETELDETPWRDLCSKATGAVAAARAAFAYYPDCPTYTGPLLGTEIDISVYEAAHDYAMNQLNNVLREAEALLTESNRIPHSIPPDTPPEAVTKSLVSHTGLRTAAALLNYLTAFLQPEDIKFRVQRRLLDDEPFFDFKRSDVVARAIGMQSLLRLASNMIKRGLPLEDCLAGLSSRLVCIAKELSNPNLLECLNASVAGSDPPMHTEFTLGNFVYNDEIIKAAAQKKFGYKELYAEIFGIYKLLHKLLLSGLQMIQSLCSLPADTNTGDALAPVNVQAMAALSPEFASTFLDSSSRLPKVVRRQALAAVCGILDSCFPPRTAIEKSSEGQLPPIQLANLKSSRDKLCIVLREHVIPRLEATVQQDYRMWHDGGQSRRTPAATSGTTTMSDSGHDAGDTGAAAEHMGSETVETLAKCYAFLLECQQLGWPAAEAKVARPYSFFMFWRQANATYRRFAMFNLTHMLYNAPSVLDASLSSTSAVRVWLQSMLDSGGRQCAYYLTEVLARHRIEDTTQLSTAKLFAGIPESKRDIRGDTTGKARAELIEAVMRNAVSCEWRTKFMHIIPDLDDILAARAKDVASTGFNPEASRAAWESTAAPSIMAILKVLLPLVAPQLQQPHVGYGGYLPPQPPPGNTNPGLDRQLKLLLNKVSIWMYSSYATLAKAWAAAKVARSMSAGNTSMLNPAAVLPDDFEDIEQLRTVADLRERAQSILFGQLPSLFQLLLIAGAPMSLDRDQDLLKPLWNIISGCIELGSGAESPNEIDTVMFEILARALTETLTDNQMSQQNDSTPHIPPLVDYVLATFVKRYLNRAHFNNESFAKAAVNAMRLVESIIEQPCMRSKEPLHQGMVLLLRPMLDIIGPQASGPVSAGVKHIVYKVVGKVLRTHPDDLLQPYDAPLPPGNFAAAMHVFWMAVCRDALHCVANRVNAGQLLAKLQEPSEKQRLSGNIPGTEQPYPQLVFPSNPESLASASNALFSFLGRPRGIEAIETLYRKFGTGPRLATALPGGGLLAAAPQASVGNANSGQSSGQFRAGDFPWKLAEEAVALITLLVSIESTSLDTDGGTQGGASTSVGLRWAFACFPALHSLIARAGSSSALLHQPYRTLRAAIEEKAGPESLSWFPLVRQQQQQQGASAQEQQQPNSASSARVSTPQVISSIKGATVADKAIVSVLGWVAVQPKVVGAGGKSALALNIADFSGAGGVKDTIMVFISEAVMHAESYKLLESSLVVSSTIDWSKPASNPVLVAFTDMQKTLAPKGTTVMIRATKHTRVQLNPETPAAAALLERIQPPNMNAMPAVSVEVQGGFSQAAAGGPRIQSQSTQLHRFTATVGESQSEWGETRPFQEPGNAAGGIVDLVEIKEEPLESSFSLRHETGNQKAGYQEGVEGGSKPVVKPMKERINSAIDKVHEMGYSRESAKDALNKLSRNAGVMSWDTEKLVQGMLDTLLNS